MCHEYILDGTKIIREKFFCLEDSSVSPYTLDFLYDAFGDVTGFIYDNCYYYYQKNIQGDVIRILDRYGNSVTEYTYDSWGKVLSSSGSLASIIGEMNPFRYRSYYYDKETGLYYVSSRYYDPEIGRWINADSVITGVGGLIQGNNMFLYCFNNPVNMKDASGVWPSWNDVNAGFKKVVGWLDDNLVRPVVGYVEDVAEDFNNYDSNNESEDVVFSSNYFSNYKGTFVIKTPFDASFSFGFIGLSTQQQNINTLKHEYGHTIQRKNMGICSYLTDVVVPSLTINILERNDKLPYDYYSYPWEAEANELGGATSSQNGKPALPKGGYTSYWDLIELFFK